MHVAVGADHAGYQLKGDIVRFLQEGGHQVLDLGAFSENPSDYPDYAEAVGLAVIGKKAERGILICGSGVGVSVAANKLPGVRAGISHDTYSARQGVEHDDVNILVIGARIVGVELAREIVRSFMDARFSHEERHLRRLKKIEALEVRYRSPGGGGNMEKGIPVGGEDGVSLGQYREGIDRAMNTLDQERVISRIWERDHTVWKPEPEEISDRLGWLDSPEKMKEEVKGVEKIAAEVRDEGYTHALLLGMGGSSLAPEVFRKIFGVADEGLDLEVLDSTDPAAVRAFDERLDPAKTLFVVSTKSGTTAETLSFFKYFFNKVVEAVGIEGAGGHFIAITDPGSILEETASALKFRAVFLNDPDIGGRYSVLSFFGIVPAALMGIDVGKLLERAGRVAGTCAAGRCRGGGYTSPAGLGTVIGKLALAGRDKLTFIFSPRLEPFGAWLEQLLAESTGKEGLGILPVDGEDPGEPAVYGEDRLFVYVRLAGDETRDRVSAALEAAGMPMLTLELKDVYDIGGEFFRWEMATAVAGFWLGINPFDQPNVESAKVLAREMLAAYQEEGRLPPLDATLEEGGISLYANDAPGSLQEGWEQFAEERRAGDYLSLQAYLPPTEETTNRLQRLRMSLRNGKKIATTLGYGPRFLHSTGQLHKGGANNGLFVQITADPVGDAAIPDEAGSTTSAISFSVLEASQALGDRQALIDAGRRVIRFHLGSDIARGLDRLLELVT